MFSAVLLFSFGVCHSGSTAPRGYLCLARQRAPPTNLPVDVTREKSHFLCDIVERADFGVGETGWNVGNVGEFDLSVGRIDALAVISSDIHAQDI